MDSQVIAAIIGAIALIIGALIQNKIDLFFFIKRFRRKTYKFSCTWEIISPTNLAKKIHDTVELKVLNDNTVTGSGLTSNLGKYIIKGIMSPHCLALHFSGTKDKRDLAGVIFLKNEPVIDKLNGSWIQFDRNGNILEGKVLYELLRE